MPEKFSFVSFKISSELYGINIMDVREVIQLCEITPIPNAPDFVDGVINLRGEIIPILNLSKRFHFKEKTYTEEEELLRSVLVIKVNDLVIGIIIDQINKVVSIYEDQIQPPPQMISGIGTEFVQGVVRMEEKDSLLIILNEKKLFNKDEMLKMSK